MSDTVGVQPPADHVTRNRAVWDGYAAGYVAEGQKAWASAEPYWGVWQVPESQLRVLPDVRGLDVAELGCGTGYVSAWLARRGARPIGLDNSAAQLATARRLQLEHRLDFPLVQADAERAPLAGGRFDLVVSEYGASIWCDPYRWVPEAARLLRPGGRLIFLVNGVVLMLCMPDED
ncbi:MAG TPA: class I SAM-dependent methyltransferase, partial [Candidatus Eisenbacteria bacterium]|nr:class I SAM-dependent methyltransferase [Candidatus Eisenbacteria bacterium]